MNAARSYCIQCRKQRIEREERAKGAYAAHQPARQGGHKFCRIRSYFRSVESKAGHHIAAVISFRLRIIGVQKRSKQLLFHPRVHFCPAFFRLISIQHLRQNTQQQKGEKDGGKEQQFLPVLFRRGVDEIADEVGKRDARQCDADGEYGKKGDQRAIRRQFLTEPTLFPSRFSLFSPLT